MPDALYRATIYLHSGSRAVVDFEYEAPEVGHRRDPDGYVTAHFLIRRIEFRGVDLKPGTEVFRGLHCELLEHHKPEMLAAVREVHKVDWESLFA